VSSRRRRKSRSRKSSRRDLDPYFVYLIFVGVGLGSLQVNPEVRLTLLWSTLLAFFWLPEAFLMLVQLGSSRCRVRLPFSRL
jgi:hypothetical protein